MEFFFIELFEKYECFEAEELVYEKLFNLEFFFKNGSKIQMKITEIKHE